MPERKLTDPDAEWLRTFKAFVEELDNHEAVTVNRDSVMHHIFRVVIISLCAGRRNETGQAMTSTKAAEDVLVEQPARDIPTPRSGGGYWVTGLDTEIGHSKRHGGVVQKITLRDWLTSDNRTPQHRARQMALALIEHQATSITTLLERERRAIGSERVTEICDEAVKLSREGGGPNHEWRCAYHGAMLMRAALTQPNPDREV